MERYEWKFNNDNIGRGWIYSWRNVFKDTNTCWHICIEMYLVKHKIMTRRVNSKTIFEFSLFTTCFSSPRRPHIGDWAAPIAGALVVTVSGSHGHGEDQENKGQPGHGCLKIFSNGQMKNPFCKSYLTACLLPTEQVGGVHCYIRGNQGKNYD